jgi:hypothetical protein
MKCPRCHYQNGTNDRFGRRLYSSSPLFALLQTGHCYDPCRVPGQRARTLSRVKKIVLVKDAAAPALIFIAPLSPARKSGAPRSNDFYRLVKVARWYSLVMHAFDVKCGGRRK